jgi:prevent-host-death family protein
MVNMHAAKTHFSRLVDQAAAGEEIVIARAGKPVARIVPFAAPKVEAPKGPRVLGVLKGSLVIPDDFDAPLPDDVLALFEGE